MRQCVAGRSREVITRILGQADVERTERRDVAPVVSPLDGLAGRREGARRSGNRRAEFGITEIVAAVVDADEQMPLGSRVTHAVRVRCGFAVFDVRITQIGHVDEQLRLQSGEGRGVRMLGTGQRIGQSDIRGTHRIRQRGHQRSKTPAPLILPNNTTKTNQ